MEDLEGHGKKQTTEPSEQGSSRCRAEFSVNVPLGEAGGGEPKDVAGANQMSWHQDTERKRRSQG